MISGQLRNLINIEHKVTNGTDPLGNVRMQWAILYQSVPASVEASSAPVTWTSATEHSQNTVTFLLRYLPVTQANMRVTFDTRVFEIITVTNDESRHTQTLIVGKEDFSAVPGALPNA